MKNVLATIVGLIVASATVYVFESLIGHNLFPLPEGAKPMDMEWIKDNIVETIVRDQPKIGRNDRVTIKHVMSGENKTVKYKQAEPLIAKGEWVLVE